MKYSLLFHYDIHVIKVEIAQFDIFLAPYEGDIFSTSSTSLSYPLASTSY